MDDIPELAKALSFQAQQIQNLNRRIQALEKPDEHRPHLDFVERDRLVKALESALVLLDPSARLIYPEQVAKVAGVVNTDRQHLKMRVDELEEKLLKVRSQRDELQEALEERHDELKHQADTIQELRRELDEQRADLNIDHTAEINALKVELERLTLDLHSAQQLVTDTHAALEDAERRGADLERQLDHERTLRREAEERVAALELYKRSAVQPGDPEYRERG